MSEVAAPDITGDPAPKADPAPASSPASAGNGQAEWSSFLDSLDPDIKDDPSLKPISDVKALAKSYVHAQRKMGANRVVLPGPNADESEWSEVFSKLGRPESPDQYKLGELDLAKEFTDEESKKFLNEYQEFAHKSNLLPNQAKGVFEWWLSKEREAAELQSKDLQSHSEAQLRALREEWGGEYTDNLERAKVALRQFASEDALKALREQGLGSNPTLLRIFADIGKNLTEDVFKGQAVSSLGMTRDEARAEIQNAFADPDGPYLNAKHPRHADEVSRIAKLMQLTS